MSGKEKKSVPKATGKSDKTTNESKSSKTDKKKKPDIRPTFLGISEDLLFEILKNRLTAFKTGIVIESLNSVFIKLPVLALTTILRAIGNVRYMHCIILSFSYANYLIFEEAMQKAAQEKMLQDTEMLLNEILEMTPEAFNNLSTDKLEVFREHTLMQRKLHLKERREALK